VEGQAEWEEKRGGGGESKEVSVEVSVYDLVMIPIGEI